MKKLSILITLSAILLMAGPIYSQQLSWHSMPSGHSAQPSSISTAPDGTIYLSTEETSAGTLGSLFRSNDGGNSWHFVCSSPEGFSIFSVCAITNSVILANLGATQDYYGPSVDTQRGMCRSTDSGKSWKIVFNEQFQSGPGSFVGCAAGNIVTQNGLYHSPDSGLTWASFLPPYASSYWYYLPMRAGLFAYRADSNLYFTSDFKTWNIVFTFQNNEERFLLPTPNGDLAFLTDSVHISTDDGMSWVTHGSFTDSLGSDNYAYPTCFLKNGCLIGGNGSEDYFYRSNDTGRTWTPIEDDALDQNGIIGIDSSNDAFIGGNGYEIDCISDTSHFTQNSTPFNIGIEALAATAGGNLAATALISPTYSTDLFVNFTTDGGQTWNNLFPLNEALVQAVWCGYQRRAGFVAEIPEPYIENAPPSFMHSPDGIAWGEVTPLPFSGSLAGFDTKGDVFISDGSVTTDQGTTWLQHQSPPGPIVIGLPDGSAVSGALSRSIDLGATWQQTSTFPKGAIRTMACDSTGNIILGTDEEVLLTKDVGKSWIIITSGLPGDTSVRQICYSTEGFWLAATSNGVYTLKEGDTTWQWNSDGLDDLNLQCIDVGGPGKYYVGTSLAGIYTTEASQSSVSIPNTHSSESALRVYPNPFTESTEITFTSPMSGYAEVSIVNMLGLEVARLFSGELGAGEHNFSWSNLAGLQDGVYECLVRMNGQVETLPVVLMH